MEFDLANLHAESFGGVRTSVADKPAPIGSHAQDVEDGVAVGALGVSFVRSGKTQRTDGRATLLDIAEACDVNLDYACRVGSCGACRTRLLGGEVTCEDDGALTPDERSQGYVLTCVARPRTDCTLDA
jgi:ferredoxin